VLLLPSERREEGTAAAGFHGRGEETGGRGAEGEERREEGDWERRGEERGEEGEERSCCLAPLAFWQPENSPFWRLPRLCFGASRAAALWSGRLQH
jgi:hypothetical protein